VPKKPFLLTLERAFQFGCLVQGEASEMGRPRRTEGGRTREVYASVRLESTENLVPQAIELRIRGPTNIRN